MLQATRTLVKSGPELWAEIADPAALEAHLQPFGDVAIEHTEPERLVVWSADTVTGTLELEPAGFGTRVRLRAESATEPVPVAARIEPPAPSRWDRLLRRRPPAPVEPEPVPVVADEAVLEVLGATLDALGTAHHRPFSRA